MPAPPIAAWTPDVCPAVFRPRSTPAVAPGDLAPAYHRRVAGHPAARCGRGLSGGGWHGAMADLSFVGGACQSDAVGPQPVDRDVGGPVQLVGQGDAVDRNRVVLWASPKRYSKDSAFASSA